MSHKNEDKRRKKKILDDADEKDREDANIEALEERRKPRHDQSREKYNMRDLVEQAKIAVFFLVLCAMLLAGIFLKLVFW